MWRVVARGGVLYVPTKVRQMLNSRGTRTHNVPMKKRKMLNSRGTRIHNVPIKMRKMSNSRS